VDEERVREGELEERGCVRATGRTALMSHPAGERGCPSARAQLPLSQSCLPGPSLIKFISVRGTPPA
jgi:hypothetical protein